MGKGKAAVSDSFLHGLFQPGVYKGSQGRVTRQVTLVALAIIVALGAWRLSFTLRPNMENGGMANAIAAVVLAAGLWLSYRAVNFPKFADFLIAVEAEMNKVSWPTRGDLVRSSLVVLFVILAMAGLLFLFDVIWKFLFEMLGVLKTFKESSGS